MKLFSQLYLALDRTTRTSEKLDALRDYFRTAEPIDSVWVVYLFTGRKIGRTVSWRQMRDWAAEAAGQPQWLVDECHHAVGDLSETLSLLLPDPADGNAPPSLHEVITERLKPLGFLPPEKQKELVARTWAQLDQNQRLVFHKLISGEFRVGASRQLLVRALADVAGVEPAVIAHRLAGRWDPDEATMRRILGNADVDCAANPALPYPFMLAHAFTGELSPLGSPDDWLIEWKWDGIRAQIIRRCGQTHLWSRGDEIVGGAFPEITQAAAQLPDGTVIDGEVVAWDDEANKPLPFLQLQRRINRQNVELSFWPDVPVTFIAFDQLEWKGEDQRTRTLAERRGLLESVIAQPALKSIVRASTPLKPESWESLMETIGESRQRGVEGVMIKRLDSHYAAGRPTGLWWKLKVQPYTVDCVMIAAQSGHGRRAGLLTDYTFGVWDNGALVPVAKAYSGLTEEEIAEVDRFARRHTITRHGPVHQVEPTLVVELGFEAIQPSNRHKSGIAVRFPRILRLRKDKKAPEADTLEMMKALLKVQGVAK